MLRIFSKIRQSLIESTGAEKYILYAIGEILLVMIGILLALQVNNWNEWRKDRIRETEVLRELRGSMTINQEVLEKSLKFIQKSISESELILKILNEKPAYSDTMARHFSYVVSIGLAIIGETSHSGYKALESKGFEIILNGELRNRIINFFEVKLPSLIERNRNNREWYFEYTSELFKKYLYLSGMDEAVDFQGGFGITDYASILNDRYFRTIVEHRLVQKRATLKEVKANIDEIEIILKLLAEKP